MTDQRRRSIEPIVSARWLTDNLGSPDLRLADCRWYLDEPNRGREEYDRGHIPGARYVSLDVDLSAPHGPGRHPLGSPETWAPHLGALGFGDDHVVVIYDDRSGAVAARMWWMLRSIGHRSVAVLDGGLAAWQAAGGSLSSEPGRYPASPLTIRATPEVIDADTLQARLGSVLLIDARDADRYRGEREPIDPIAGHIPTAVNLPMTGNLATDGTFADAATLRSRYRAAGADGTTEAVVYCGSGVTACHDILAMEIAGYPPATLYPGSWSDWSTAGRDVAVGDSPWSSAE